MLLDRYRRETREKTSRKAYELIMDEYDRLSGCEGYHERLLGILKESDKEVYGLIAKEYDRLRNTIQLLAAENQCSRAVLGALGSIIQNKTAEGFPHSRRHGGCSTVDEIEALAAARAKKAFAARYANVQPHSGSSANQIVFKALLKRGDKILSLSEGQGGHASHGGVDSLARSFFDIEEYRVEQESFVFDYERIRQKAHQIKPKLIMCGASAYPREIDFKKFRAIADETGAYLLADISHITSLVIAGAHPSPVDFAHFTTTSTYKAGGPRGGLILMGKDYDEKITTEEGTSFLRELIEKATFPGVQGTPYFNNIAAKAVFLQEAVSDAYKTRQFNVVANAKRLAENLRLIGLDILTGGTDNHMILVNVSSFAKGLNGVLAQKALQQCGVVVDPYRLPFEDSQQAATGLRLGTPIVTRNGMGASEMGVISEMIKQILQEVKVISDSEYEVSESFCADMTEQVRELCSKFPIQ